MLTIHSHSFSFLNLRRSHFSQFEFGCSNYLALTFSLFNIQMFIFAIVSFNILIDCSIRAAVTLSVVFFIQCTSSQL